MQATSHWGPGGSQGLSRETVERIVNNAVELGGRSRQPSRASSGEPNSSAAMESMRETREPSSGESGLDGAGPRVMKINVLDAPSFQLPNQENRLALVLDPLSGKVPFTFGVEMFPEGHVTPPHVHDAAHEMFFVLSGNGTAFCDGSSFPLGAGDCVVFPPGSVHGVNTDEKMYCLELMLPNEEFAEFVRSGSAQKGYDTDDSCILAAIGCG